MSIELPKDAEGREIPLDTEVLYDECGTKVSVKEFLSRTLVESQKNSWTIKAQYEGNFYYNSFKPKNMHLTLPDTWEKLLDDLDKASSKTCCGTCSYFGMDPVDCDMCAIGDMASCDLAVMRDIASRIRKLRGEDE